MWWVSEFGECELVWDIVGYQSWEEPVTLKKRTGELSIQVFGEGRSSGRRHGRRGILSFSRQVR